jgi:hypothetical protein
VNTEKLGLSYIRFLYGTSFHVTIGVICPERGHLSFFYRLRHSWIRASEACSGLPERCLDASDDEPRPNDKEGAPERYG